MPLCFVYKIICHFPSSCPPGGGCAPPQGFGVLWSPTTLSRSPWRQFAAGGGAIDTPHVPINYQMQHAFYTRHRNQGYGINIALKLHYNKEFPLCIGGPLAQFSVLCRHQSWKFQHSILLNIMVFLLS